MPQCKADRETADGTLWFCVREKGTHNTHIDDEGVEWTEHPAHRGHEFGGGYARAAALVGGAPDWMTARGGTERGSNRPGENS